MTRQIRLGPCPICRRPGQAATRPFCSRRCAEADLGCWLTGAYVLPGEPATDDDSNPGGDAG